MKKRLALLTLFIILMNIVYTPLVLAGDFVLFGPYVPLSAGEYEMTLHYSARGVRYGTEVGTIEATGDKGMQKLGFKGIVAGHASGNYEQCLMQFKTLGTSNFECRIRWSGKGTLILRQIKLAKLKDYSPTEAVGSALIKGATGFRSISSSEALLREGESVEWKATDGVFNHDIGQSFDIGNGVVEGAWMVTEDNNPLELSKFQIWLAGMANNIRHAKGLFSEVIISLAIALVILKSAKVMILWFQRYLHRTGRIDQHSSFLKKIGANIYLVWLLRAVLFLGAVFTVANLTKESYTQILAWFEKYIIIWILLLIALRPLKTVMIILSSFALMFASTIMLFNGFQASGVRLGNYSAFLLIVAVGIVWRDKVLTELSIKRLTIRPAGVLEAFKSGLAARKPVIVKPVVTKPVTARSQVIKPVVAKPVNARPPVAKKHVVEKSVHVTNLSRIERLHARRRQLHFKIAKVVSISIASLLIGAIIGFLV